MSINLFAEHFGSESEINGQRRLPAGNRFLKEWKGNTIMIYVCVCGDKRNRNACVFSSVNAMTQVRRRWMRTYYGCKNTQPRSGGAITWVTKLL